MVKIILIKGKARHGKDSMTNILKQELELQGKTVIIDRFAKYIKQYCLALGWDGETKDEYWRDKLQKIGTEIIKEELNYTSFHAKRIAEDFKILKATQKDISYFIVPDLRFRDEYHTLCAYFPDSVVTIEVIRGDGKSILEGDLAKHKSENDLNNFKCDYTIRANNLIELETYTKTLLNSYLEPKRMER